MASNDHSYHPEKRVSAAEPPRQRKPASSASIPQKQSYTGCKLPGKASNGFAAMKKGLREINGYAAYNGLSQSSGGGNMSFRQETQSPKIVQRNSEWAEKDLNFRNTTIAGALQALSIDAADRQRSAYAEEKRKKKQ